MSQYFMAYKLWWILNSSVLGNFWLQLQVKMFKYKLSCDKIVVLYLLLPMVSIMVLFNVKATRQSSTIADIKRRSMSYHTRKICIQVANTLRARHKSCFLRPDTGPCRADLIQWYFDVKQHKCYRFFWGGCQGNGNRFETKEQCEKHCFLSPNAPPERIPYFCDVAFDYGTCFGYFNRWGWDRYSKTCKRRLYSGCGGNQNNFETRDLCLETCSKVPFSNFSISKMQMLTTCIPIV